MPSRKPTPGRLVAEQTLIDCRPSEAESNFSTPAVVFRLKNVGGESVRILSVESGCGCAKPTVQPSLVKPGLVAAVEVTAKPIPVGGRFVPITVTTDSSDTPRVHLQLHILSNRLPPFLLRAYGDLTFTSDEGTESPSRSISVETVESGKTGVVPKLQCDLTFLDFDPPKVSETPQEGSPGVILRKYEFAVQFNPKAPTEAFAGTVLVTDPWDSDHQEAVNVLGEARSHLRSIPSRIILELDDQDRAVSQRFFLRSTDHAPDFQIEWQGGQEVSLVVERVKSADSDRLAAFEIHSMKEKKVVAGVYRLKAKSEGTHAGNVTIPVMVKSKGGVP